LLVLFFILVGLWLGMGGCASGTYGHSSLVSGDGPSAELVVLRRRGFSLGAFALQVKLDGEKLAKLRSGRFAEFRVRPGVYRLTMGSPGIPARVICIDFDTLQLDAGTRNYVLLGKQNESWRYSSTPPRYCLSARCGRIGQSSKRKSVSFVFGFDRITEELAQALMGAYIRVGHE